jgi:ectoine hydroxylase-related dioxygenase (phytanoyl-CoA dioxygenase family)
VIAFGHTATVGLDVATDELDAFASGRKATPEELAALDKQGFVVVPALLSEAVVAALDAEFERLVKADPQSSRHELGTRRAKAARDNEVFAVCWRHRLVLDAAAHVLGSPFQVGHVDLRDPDPGYGEQRLHPDHGPTPVPGITATWFLDAFTVENGATRILPGSHRSLPANSDVTQDGLHTIPGSEVPVSGEVLALGASGSLLLRDARLFHAAGRNTTKSFRRSAFVFYQHDIPEPEPHTPMG